MSNEVLQEKQDNFLRGLQQRRSEIESVFAFEIPIDVQLDRQQQQDSRSRLDAQQRITHFRTEAGKLTNAAEVFSCYFFICLTP